MSSPRLTTTNSKLDIRVKEPSVVVPPSSGPGSPDRFMITICKKKTKSLNKRFT